MAIILEKGFFGNELVGSYFLLVQNYNCKVLVFEREDAAHFKDYTEDFNKPAVYILLNRDLRKAYVGETDTFPQRLQSHLSGRTFWNIAYAFTTNDSSLSKTEVRYLEAKILRHVEELGLYDISENGQKPPFPQISYVQKLKAEAFFKTILKMAELTDCDVLYAHTPKVKKKSEIKQTQTKTSIKQATSLDGRVKMMLNGKGPFDKNRFVHAVIKEYHDTHPSASLAELKQIFSRDLLGERRSLELIEENITAAKELLDRGHKRHFLDDILVSGDNIPFVVCDQWDKHNLPNIIALVKQFGWSYSIVQ